MQYAALSAGGVWDCFDGDMFNELIHAFQESFCSINLVMGYLCGWK